MKKLLIITTFLSSMIMSSVAYAEWTKVVENVSGVTFYVDLERIKKHNGKVYFWELADYLKPDKHGVISAKTYVEAECGHFRFRWLNASFYKGPMGSLPLVLSNNTPEIDWKYPPPNTADEAVLKAVCNHK